MNTLQYVLNKYELNQDAPSSIPLNIKRHDMCDLFKELGFTKGAEIGVEWGHFSEELCQKNPNLKMYCIDPWDNLDNTIFEEAKKRLAPYNCEIIKKTSMDAVKDFAPNSLDFVYIDGNHFYDHVLEDLTEWSKIVKPDGIISGHDYLTHEHPEIGVPVKMAIDKYVSDHKITKLFMVNKNYSSNWFFINE